VKATLVALALSCPLLLPLAAQAQRCTATELSDMACDCGCGVVDTRCPAGRFVVCEVAHCPAGQVPWEHTPSDCMMSACGDGWRDEAAGEACDDGNALASGGCSANCRAVNPGYVCGVRAQGCRLAPADAGMPDGGANAGGGAAGGAAGGASGGGTAGGSSGGPSTVGDGGVLAGDAPKTGCTASGLGPLVGLALLFARRRRP
jgi:cysteine-rich repeat protein